MKEQNSQAAKPVKPTFKSVEGAASSAAQVFPVERASFLA